MYDIEFRDVVYSFMHLIDYVYVEEVSAIATPQPRAGVRCSNRLTNQKKST